ncbi:MAG: 4-hydroxythreonine-4-phosphate dehydrogenase, partial [Rhodospirillales bacterium]
MTKPIAITMGDPAGVGGELTISAWLTKHTSSNAFYVYDCPRRLHALARHLKVDVAIAEISHPEEAFSCFSKALPVLPVT